MNILNDNRSLIFQLRRRVVLAAGLVSPHYPCRKNQFLSSTILNNANSRDHVLAIDFCTIRWATRLPFDFGTGSDFFPPIAFYRTIFLIASWNYCSYQISSSLFTTLLQSRRNRGILAIPRSPRTILINWRRYWFRVFVNF
jgi:hypothetical protein